MNLCDLFFVSAICENMPVNPLSSFPSHSLVFTALPFLPLLKEDSVLRSLLTADIHS